LTDDRTSPFADATPPLDGGGLDTTQTLPLDSSTAPEPTLRMALDQSTAPDTTQKLGPETTQAMALNPVATGAADPAPASAAGATQVAAGDVFTEATPAWFRRKRFAGLPGHHAQHRWQ
jgi:hypothetical protein